VLTSSGNSNNIKRMLIIIFLVLLLNVDQERSISTLFGALFQSRMLGLSELLVVVLPPNINLSGRESIAILIFIRLILVITMKKYFRPLRHLVHRWRRMRGVLESTKAPLIVFVQSLLIAPKSKIHGFLEIIRQTFLSMTMRRMTGRCLLARKRRIHFVEGLESDWEREKTKMRAQLKDNSATQVEWARKRKQELGL
jgi:hypothetical protein